MLDGARAGAMAAAPSGRALFICCLLPCWLAGWQQQQPPPPRKLGPAQAAYIQQNAFAASRLSQNRHKPGILRVAFIVLAH